MSSPARTVYTVPVRTPSPRVPGIAFRSFLYFPVPLVNRQAGHNGLVGGG